MTTETDELAALRAEVAALRLQVESPQDSLEQALAEFDAQHVSVIPGARMTLPCFHEVNGKRCNGSWADHNPPKDGIPARIRGHSYRDYEWPDSYRERFAFQPGEPGYIPPIATESVTLEDQFMTEKQAAAALKTSIAKLRRLVKDGAIAADRIGTVTLIRKIAVERIVAMKALAEADEQVAIALEEA